MTRTTSTPCCSTSAAADEPRLRGAAGRYAVAGLRAFTLIELLVVISIVALLITILLPALQGLRQRGRLTQCLANLRSQGAALHGYLTENAARLPPRMFTDTRPTSTEFVLINNYLARYSGAGFEPVEVGWPVPSGIWRCPEVRAGDEEELRWTHFGYLHHAPNRWLFNSLSYYWVNDHYTVSSDAPQGWEDLPVLQQWHIADRVAAPSQVVAFIDNVNFQPRSHPHREARDAIGLSSDVVFDAANTRGDDNYPSHEALARVPGVMLDGHGEVQPISADYWRGLEAFFQTPAGQASSFYEREARRFMWFLLPQHAVQAPTE